MKICPNFHVSLPPSVIKEKVVFFLVGQVAWRHPCGHERSSGLAALLVRHAVGLVGLGHNAKAEPWSRGGGIQFLPVPASSASWCPKSQ